MMTVKSTASTQNAPSKKAQQRAGEYQRALKQYRSDYAAWRARNIDQALIDEVECIWKRMNIATRNELGRMTNFYGGGFDRSDETEDDSDRYFSDPKPEPPKAPRRRGQKGTRQ